MSKTKKQEKRLFAKDAIPKGTSGWRNLKNQKRQIIKSAIECFVSLILILACTAIIYFPLVYLINNGYVIHPDNLWLFYAGCLLLGYLLANILYKLYEYLKYR